ncbi:sugar ABC transporter ATP-binding protein [Egicoccus halophilus]|uniref:Ribose import ATP-binding protein RbsA n=1 Tax=Egicoccus halophilus TaxID=1670830 RepID=A0A8J3AAT8_9ACTN|nr:sugar ABC transporter ATP-binding protein [Egicoccus halophilus]GGI03467.1 ribose import ATP-binding protein RbsA [Egicoccus halophilus]
MSFLEMRDVHKRYGGVRALNGADLFAERGEVHALLGANGSGKSTMNKILTGIAAPDQAELRLDGEPLRVTRPQDAHRLGIAAVYQELSLIPDLTVAANVGLAFEATTAGFLRPRAIRSRAEAVLRRFAGAFSGDRLPVDVPVGQLSPGEQQVIEICKAIAREPRVLVLDEATASLHAAQVEVLFDVVRQLRDDGILVLFTSHRMGEIYALCDRATVLRNGEVAGAVQLAETSEAQLVEMMVGRQTGVAESTGATIPMAAERQPVVLQVEDVVGDRLAGVSLEVHAGEVLGLGGLAGQGQSALLAAIFGAQRRRSGRLLLDGRELRIRRPSHAVAEGIAFVPGNRAREGLLPVRPILENLTLASMRGRAVVPGVLSQKRERAAADQAVEQLRIKLGSVNDPVSTLSGGNQQKVVVGKWLLEQPRVVLLDDPTKGIDVAAKDELYEVIARLTEEGVAVILNSSDDEELLGLSHRVLVFYEGRVVDELHRADLSRDRLVASSLQVVDR